jgi:8-oxo-dGTP pyrophosphatase MutT (NUDIX family)
MSAAFAARRIWCTKKNDSRPGWRLGAPPRTLVAVEQRLSAGVVVVRESDAGPRLLLLRAYRNWDFPKGLVEPGEEPIEAAVREANEETGLTDLAFDWGTEFVETEPYARNKVARYYLARTRTQRVVLKVNSALGRPEHHEYRWVDLTEAVALTVPRLQRVIAWAATKVIRPA